MSKYSLDSDNKETYGTRAEKYNKLSDINTDDLNNTVVYPITDKIIDNVSLLEVNTLTKEKSEKLRIAHKELLKTAMKDNKSMEVAIMYDKSMKQIGSAIFGTATSVDLNVSGRSLATYVIHNHPNNASFSNKDISWLMNNDNVKYFSIVKNNGETELIHIPYEFDKKIFETEYKRLVKKHQKDIDKDIQSGYNKVVEKLLTKSKSGIEYVR